MTAARKIDSAMDNLSLIRAAVRVFVSSTWEDLRPERKAVESVVHRTRAAKFIGMEYFGSREQTTANASLAEVDNCDI